MKRGILFLLILLPLLGGCGAASVAAGAAAQEPTSLQVSFVNLLPENHYSPFPTRTVVNKQAVQQLYTAALKLPRPKYTWMNSRYFSSVSCPVDLGLEYHLRFFYQQTLMREMIVYPTGCWSVLVGKNDSRVLTNSFFQLFEQTIGVPKGGELPPAYLYSCTPHSPCLSPTPTHQSR
jgi:hypothetical protein